jgi:transposase
MSNQEFIRRKIYCQTVKEITGSDQYLVVGIDVAKDKHHAFLGTANGKSLYRRLIFENNADGFSMLIKITKDIRNQNGLSKVVYGMEPTGNYHKPLANYLIHNNCNVVLVTGQAVKNNRKILDGRWDKNDTKDAANVADLVSRGRCLYYDMPDQEITELRNLLSLRRSLKREEHRLRMRIRNTLVSLYFPELDRHYSASESESLAIARWCLSPDKIASMSFDQFFKIVTSSRRGLAQKLRLRKIYQAAANSIGCPMNRSGEFEADMLVEKLLFVRKHLRNTEDLIEEIGLKFSEYKYLISIPGFGRYITARVLASIGDPFRFENRKQLIKMAGLDLCANRSGKNSDKAIPVISKNGSSELRYALYQAAHVAASRVDQVRVYFAGLLQGRERERGIKTKMHVKLASKMLVIAWTLMKRKESFDPGHLAIE